MTAARYMSTARTAWTCAAHGQGDQQFLTNYAIGQAEVVLALMRLLTDWDLVSCIPLGQVTYEAYMAHPPAGTPCWAAFDSDERAAWDAAGRAAVAHAAKTRGAT